MTKQEAIDRLRDLLVPVILDNTANPHPQAIQAMEMAIQTLKQQEEICYCKDCINKEIQFEGTELEETYCIYHHIYKIKDTDYCSWGERGDVQND